MTIHVPMTTVATTNNAMTYDVSRHVRADTNAFSSWSATEDLESVIGRVLTTTNSSNTFPFSPDPASRYVARSLVASTAVSRMYPNS